METIRSNTEISLLFEKGRRFSGRDVLLIVSNSLGDDTGRVAFVAGRRNGGAVWRNKAKRRLRAAARAAGAPWEGFDVAFVAKKTTTACSFSSLVDQVQKAAAHAREM